MTSSPSNPPTLEAIEADIARTRVRISETVRRVDDETHALMNPQTAPAPIKDGNHRLDTVDVVALALRAVGHVRHRLAGMSREQRMSLGFSALAAVVVMWRARSKRRTPRRIRLRHG